MVPKTICLNMIVKDEAHIITDTLEKLTNKIIFKYYVICDTGSSDDTIILIETFFKNKNIPGEIFIHKWEDFGHNRSLALEKAYGKSDYVLIFDADDSIEGKFVLPELTHDAYMLKFGDSCNSYERMCLVKNNIKWKYIGVLHEYISCDQPISKGYILGDYHVISGRTSSRNSDPQKYLKDAIILENAYAKALKKGDSITNRYVYYCANSYLDAGDKDNAIKWYKMTLKSNGWFDERYNSCLKLYDLTNDQQYLIQSFHHNPRRVEGIFYLIRHYCCESMWSISMGYYSLIKNYYENEYLQDNLSTKLFAKPMEYSFYLPYYMVIVCDKMNDRETGLKMYSIIFEKMTMADQWWMNNLIFNFQFFIASASMELLEKFNIYLQFIESNGIKLDNNLLHSFEQYNFYYTVKNKIINQKPKLLIYTGFSKVKWNLSYSKENALGGSENAVLYLAQELSKDYHIIISGDVIEETIGDITFINRFNLKNEHYNCIIVSRYVSFFILHPDITSDRLIMMAHDTTFMNHLVGNNTSPEELVEQNKDRINLVVCLTKWHGEEYSKLYPSISSKIRYINNGINPDRFPKNDKIRDSFVFTSCSYRGLDRLIEIWGDIIKELPEATLHISSYDEFPKDEFDNGIVKMMDKLPGIKHYGKLNHTDLYSLMSKMEYWIYPCNFNETSCITSLEMLMAEVICLYYPIAGLTDTMGEYGLQISKGNEVETLLDLSYRKKTEIRKKGKEYALSCSWKNRAVHWKQLIEGTLLVFFAPGYFGDELLAEYIVSLKTKYNVVYTKDINFIKKESYRIDEIVIVHELNELSLFDFGIPVSYLNTEPLNLECRLSYVLYDIDQKYDIHKFYDYSLSNIKILNERGIQNTKHFPYLYNEPEINFLIKCKKKNKKIYNLGIICSSGMFTNNVKELRPPRRRKLVEHLISKGVTVNIIKGFNKQRDIELSKCKHILNIHGSYEDDPSMIFEHIRCDRLLMAGYSIISESSLHIPDEFQKSYPKLSFMDYSSFFSMKKNYCFIHSCNLNGTKRLEHLMKKLSNFKVFEKIFINNIGNPIDISFQENIEVTNYSNDCKLYEIPTLNKIHLFSQEQLENVNVLYIHTKGVSYPDDYHEENDWINLMLHYLLDIRCVYLLNNYQTVGCNYTTDGFNYDAEGYMTPAPPHFSGNFWWATSEYLKTLDYLVEKDVNKNDAEYWLMKNKPSYYELHHSGIDHFHNRYPTEMYY